jgi:hypothetical protein
VLNGTVLPYSERRELFAIALARAAAPRIRNPKYGSATPFQAASSGEPAERPGERIHARLCQMSVGRKHVGKLSDSQIQGGGQPFSASFIGMNYSPPIGVAGAAQLDAIKHDPAKACGLGRSSLRAATPQRPPCSREAVYANYLHIATPAAGAIVGSTPQEGFFRHAVSLSSFHHLGYWACLCRPGYHTKLQSRALPGGLLRFERPLQWYLLYSARPWSYYTIVDGAIQRFVWQHTASTAASSD